MMHKYFGWIVTAVVVCGLCLLVYLSISTLEEDLENQLAALDGIKREQFLLVCISSPQEDVWRWADNKLRRKESGDFRYHALSRDDEDIQLIALSELEYLGTPDESLIQPLIRLLPHRGARHIKAVSLLSRMGDAAASEIWMAMATGNISGMDGQRALKGIWGDIVDDGIHDWTGWGSIYREKMSANAQATLDKLLTERNPRFEAIPATTVWTKGGIAVIRCMITNLGKTPMKFVRVYQAPPLPPAQEAFGYPDRPEVWLDVRNPSGGDARREIGIDENSRITVTENSQTAEAVPQLGSKFRFTGYPGPRYDEIVTILPGESLTYTMSVIVRWEPGAYRSQAVYYYCETVYEPVGNGRMSGVEYGPSPAWKGEIRSNIFDVTVK